VIAQDGNERQAEIRSQRRDGVASRWQSEKGREVKINLGGETERMDREYIKENLPCTLTQDETLEKAKELAKLQQDKVQAEEQAKSAAATFKDRIAGAQSHINILSRDISNGYEYRETDCYWEFDYKTRRKSLVRSDTCETVRTKEITPSEMQKELDIEAA
jgi:hypothetical protein